MRCGCPVAAASCRSRDAQQTTYARVLRLGDLANADGESVIDHGSDSPRASRTPCTIRSTGPLIERCSSKTLPTPSFSTSADGQRDAAQFGGHCDVDVLQSFESTGPRPAGSASQLRESAPLCDDIRAAARLTVPPQFGRARSRWSSPSLQPPRKESISNACREPTRPGQLLAIFNGSTTSNRGGGSVCLKLEPPTILPLSNINARVPAFFSSWVVR